MIFQYLEIRFLYFHQHFSVVQRNEESVVVGVGGLQHVPLTVVEIFYSGCWQKTLGMPAKHGGLSVYEECHVTRSCYVQVGQTFCIHLHQWAFIAAVTDGCSYNS